MRSNADGGAGEGGHFGEQAGGVGIDGDDTLWLEAEEAFLLHALDDGDEGIEEIGDVEEADW